MEPVYVVYNIVMEDDEFEGTQDECENYLANYGGGWAALTIMPKKIALLADKIANEK